MIGRTLAHFKITAKLGAGGMGEVYRATDTRLDRTVAVKVLPAHLADDPQSRERFEREARAVSSLNHPHICTLHDVGEQDGLGYLVMELVEGETLAARLKRGLLPLEKALEFAAQIADALDKAHRQGVVHRDLKPGNIMVTKSGTKLLDFGLARLGVGSPIATSSQVDTQDETEPLTAQGAIVGTLQYMAPEQLKGESIDARTDIFSFGVVVYEMVTGKRAFEGTNQASLIAAILHGDPQPLSELEAVLPPMLERIVTTCLAKEKDDRWQSAADIVRQIKWVDEGCGESASTSTPMPGRWRFLPWTLAVLGLAIATVALMDRMLPSPPVVSRPSNRLAIELPAEAPLAPASSFFLGVGRPSLAMSGDGSRLAYVALVDGERELYLRDMHSGDVEPIPGTRDAQGPFFSPDGQWLGFFAENKLKRVRPDGGEPQELANAVWGYGAEWGEEYVYFAPTEAVRLMRVPVSGGPAEAVTSFSGAWPALLPGRSELLVSKTGVVGSSVLVASFGDEPELRPILRGTAARYLPTGHLAYSRSGKLLVAPFDLSSLQVTGDSTVLVDDVRSEAHGGLQATWSDDGTLVYASGPDLSMGELVWLDRQGEREALGLPPGNFTKFELSPDGGLLALPVRDGATRDIWIHELGRSAPQRLTLGGAESIPVWDRRGESIYYASEKAVGNGIYRIGVGGANQQPVELVAPNPRVGRPYQEIDEGLLYDRAGDVALLRIDPGADPPATDMRSELVLDGPFQEAFASLSPDRRWLAYMSDETGQWQIYVVSYPDQGTKRLVSSTGGEEPQWSPDGSEIIYRYGPRWFSASVADDPALVLGAPRVLFEGPFINIPGYSWDISPADGRFLLVENSAQNEPLGRLEVITNFFDEVRRRIPVEQ